MGLENHVPVLPTIGDEVVDQESFRYALQLVASVGLPMSLKCAIELGIFDVIDRAGTGAKLSASEIAAQLPIASNIISDAPPMLDSLLRLLASHSVVSCCVSNHAGSDSQRLYGLLPVTKYFVTNKDGASLGPMMLLLQDNVFLAGWYVRVASLVSSYFLFAHVPAG